MNAWQYSQLCNSDIFISQMELIDNYYYDRVRKFVQRLWTLLSSLWAVVWLLCRCTTEDLSIYGNVVLYKATSLDLNLLEQLKRNHFVTMEDYHREAIQKNISSLISRTDLELMLSALEEKGVFTEHNLDKYRDISTTPMQRKRQMYDDITRRGPKAYYALLDALQYNGYWDLVRMLDPNSDLSISKPSLNGNTSRRTPDKNEFVSLCDSKKTESELLNSHNVPPIPASTATAHSKKEVPTIPTGVPFIVNKSTKFVDDDPSNDIRMYPTRGKQRGVLLMFTYTNFKNNVDKQRLGAELDAANLKYLFTEIGIKPLVFTDLTLKDTRNTLEDLRSKLAPGLESVFVVVSSHGYEHRTTQDTDVRCSDGKLLALRDIIGYFSNERLPHLTDVPKVFIFQLCRGTKDDFLYANRTAPPHLPRPAETDGTPELAGAPGAARRALVKMALFTNILVVQSTLPGFVSRRDPDRGSWYMQVLCEKFAERAHDCHVEKLFKMVDVLLQERFEIQTSSVDSWGFNRRLYLHPGLFQ